MEHIEENHAHPIGDHFDNSSHNCRNHCEEKHPETAFQIIPRKSRTNPGNEKKQRENDRTTNPIKPIRVLKRKGIDTEDVADIVHRVVPHHQKQS